MRSSAARYRRLAYGGPYFFARLLWLPLAPLLALLRVPVPLLLALRLLVPLLLAPLVLAPLLLRLLLRLVLLLRPRLRLGGSGFAFGSSSLASSSASSAS